MEEYSNYLTNIKYPINYNRPSLKNNPEEVHRGLALGLVGIRPLYRKYKEETHRECCALKWKKYKDVMEISTKLFNEYCPEPDFKWTTIQYNWNQKSAKHKDKNNVGESYIIALGDYEGGRLKVWHNDNEEPEYVDIKNKFFKFNGAKLYHETEDFTGTRLSLVFFNLLNKD
jgi:hypothetical protein